MRDVGKIEKLSFHEYITWDSFFQSIDPGLSRSVSLNLSDRPAVHCGLYGLGE
jgi:hypothetical protein